MVLLVSILSSSSLRTKTPKNGERSAGNTAGNTEDKPRFANDDLLAGQGTGGWSAQEEAKWNEQTPQDSLKVEVLDSTPVKKERDYEEERADVQNLVWQAYQLDTPFMVCKTCEGPGQVKGPSKDSNRLFVTCRTCFAFIAHATPLMDGKDVMPKCLHGAPMQKGQCYLGTYEPLLSYACITSTTPSKLNHAKFLELFK
jgi:hypothetical protein